MFKGIKIKNNKFINQVAMSTFGVLLIHNNDFILEILWNKILNTLKVCTSNTNLIYIHSFTSVLLVFIICIIIDQLRIKFIELPFFKLINNKIDVIDNKINNYFSK